MRQTILKSFTVVIMIMCASRIAYIRAQDKTPSSNKASIPEEVRFVAAGIIDSREKLHCAQANINYYQFIPKTEVASFVKETPAAKDSVKVQDQETVYTAHWYFDEPNLSMTVTLPRAPESDTLQTARLVTDGKQVKILHELFLSPEAAIKDDPVYHADGIVEPVDRALVNGVWKTFHYLDPRAYTTHLGLIIEASIDSLLLNPHFSSTYKGTEMVEGSRCMKIEVSIGPEKDRQFLLWIDTEHGFLTRRAEQYRQSGQNKVLVTEWKMPQIQESNGFWFPAVAEKKSFLGKGIPPIISRLTVTHFRAECDMPLEVFRLNWPLNAYVRDEISGKEFVVSARKPEAREP